MFYLKVNKVKILNNRELIGKAEIQFMSFVTPGESDFPSLKEFFDTNDENQKKEIVKQAMAQVIGSRKLLPVYKFKDNQEVAFGDTGYILYEAEKTPKDFNWMFLAIELDKRTRQDADLASKIITDQNVSNVVGSIEKLASVANPVAGAITELTTFVAKSVTEVMKNDRDDQAGFFLSSFIEQEDYPNGRREKEDVPDLTSNMYIGYSIVSYN